MKYSDNHPDDPTACRIFDANGEFVGSICNSDKPHEWAKEKARRIVAAVNACEGYTAKDLELLTPLRETVSKWVALCKKQEKEIRQLNAQLEKQA